MPRKSRFAVSMIVEVEHGADSTNLALAVALVK